MVVLLITPDSIIFARTLADAGKHGITAVLRRDVGDQLLDQHGLAYAGTAEETDLTTLLVRAEKVNDLDARLEDLRIRRLFCKIRRRSMDRIVLHPRRRLLLVDRIAEHVEHAPQSRLAYRHRDRRSGGLRLHAAHETVRRTHGDTADRVVTEVLCNLDHKDFPVLPADLDRVIDLRKVALREPDVQNGTDDLCYLTNVFLHGSILLDIFLLYSETNKLPLALAYVLSALAPAMISVSSCVIELWRARLYASSSFSIMSLALFVALSMACMRAPFSLA